MFCFVFFLEGETSSSTCCYGYIHEGENVVSLKNRTGMLSDHSMDKLHSAAGAWDVSEMLCGSEPEPAVPTVQLVRWDMDLFTVSLPSDLSGCCPHGHQHLGPSFFVTRSIT